MARLNVALIAGRFRETSRNGSSSLGTEDNESLSLGLILDNAPSSSNVIEEPFTESISSRRITILPPTLFDTVTSIDWLLYGAKTWLSDGLPRVEVI